MSKIIIKDLSKTFESGAEKIEVFKIPKLSFLGEKLTAITGSSGSGKSTLLQIIAGLDSATTGDVILSGKIANDLIKKESSEII